MWKYSGGQEKTCATDTVVWCVESTELQYCFLNGTAMPPRGIAQAHRQRCKKKKKEEHTQLNSYSIHSIGSKGASVFISIKLENSR